MRASVVLLLFLVLTSLAAQKPAFRKEWPIQKHVYNFPEQGDRVGGAVVLGAQKFCFLPPGNCLQDANWAEKKVTLTARDFSFVFSFQVLQTALPEAFWRQKVLDQFPEATITGEFKCAVADRNGMAYEVQRMSGKKQIFATRIVFVPLPEGMLKFEMTTPPEKLKKTHRLFGSFLSNFQILKAPALPAKGSP